MQTQHVMCGRNRYMSRVVGDTTNYTGGTRWVQMEVAVGFTEQEENIGVCVCQSQRKVWNVGDCMCKSVYYVCGKLAVSCRN